jgi:hypothetical protein
MKLGKKIRNSNKDFQISCQVAKSASLGTFDFLKLGLALLLPSRLTTPHNAADICKSFVRFLVQKLLP